MIERWQDRLDGNMCRCCGHCIPECHMGDIAFAQPSSIAKTCPNYLHLIAAQTEDMNKFPDRAPDRAMPTDDSHVEPPDIPGDKIFEHLALAVCEKRFDTLNWPVKFPLVPVDAVFFHDADIIIIADCAALIVDDIYSKYIGDGPAVMLCPKMQDTKSIAGKLRDILVTSRPKSLTILRMEVPCCNGMAAAAAEAVESSHAGLAFVDIVVSLDGAEY